MAMYARPIYHKYDSRIMNFIAKEVLLQNQIKATLNDPDWIDFQELPVQGQAKVC